MTAAKKPTAKKTSPKNSKTQSAKKTSPKAKNSQKKSPTRAKGPTNVNEKSVLALQFVFAAKQLHRTEYRNGGATKAKLLSYLRQNLSSSPTQKTAIQKALNTSLGGGFVVSGSGSATRYMPSDEMRSMSLVCASA